MQVEKSLDHEISLLDIIDFLADEWKIILSIVLTGIGIGVITFKTLPAQFEANVFIQGAKVAVASGKDMKSIDVEPVSFLAEKMRSPNYYDSKTLAACFSEGEAGNLEVLADALDAHISKNSYFVSVGYRSKSKDAVLRCLEQVLVTVVERQRPLVESNLTFFMQSLDIAKKQADELRTMIKQQELDGRLKLRVTDEEYSAAGGFLDVMVQSPIQMVLSAEKEIYRIESLLKPPYTQEAKFILPIFPLEQKLSRSLSQTVMISAIVSFFFGVLLLFFRRVFARVMKERRERLKSMSITP